MPLDNKVQITITGKDEASPALKAAGKSLEELRIEHERLITAFQDEKGTNGLSDSAKALRDQANEVKAAIDSIMASNRGAGTSPLSDLVDDAAVAKTAVAAVAGEAEQMGVGVAASAAVAEPALAGVGATGAAAGVAIDVAFAPVTATIGAIVAIAGGLVIAMGAVIALGASAIQQASEWGSAVDRLHDVTGMTMEAASGIAYLGVESGKTPEQMGDAVNKTVQVIGEASDRIDQMERDAAAAKEQYDQRIGESGAASATRRTEDERAHLEAVDNLRRQAAQREADAQEQMAERAGDLARERARSSEALYERLTELAESHAERAKGLEQSLADLRDGYAAAAEERATKLADRLAEFDEKAGDRRLNWAQRIASARDDLEREALTAQLAEVDKATAAEREKIVAKGAEEERRAKAAEDKRIAEIEARIARENAVYAKQAEKLKADAAERDREREEAYQRETARMEKALARQRQATEDRIEAENAAYERMERAREQAAGRAASAAAAQYQKALDTINSQVPDSVKALEALGLRFEDLRKMSPDEKFIAIETALSKVDNAMDRMKLAERIYGHGGYKEFREVIDTLADKSFKDLQREAEAAGRIVSDEEANNYEKARRNTVHLDASTKNLAIAVGQELAPAWTNLSGKLATFIDKHGPAIIGMLSALAKDVLPKVVEGIDGFFNALERVEKSEFFKMLTRMYSGVNPTDPLAQNIFKVMGNLLSGGQSSPTISPADYAAAQQAASGLTPTMYGSIPIYSNSSPAPGSVNTSNNGGGPNRPSGQNGPNITINQTNQYQQQAVDPGAAMKYALISAGLLR